MARTRDDDTSGGDDNYRITSRPPPSRASGRRRDPRPKEQSISCMLNTEVGSVLAVIRRTPPDPASAAAAAVAASGVGTYLPSPPPDAAGDGPNAQIIASLKALRSLIFRPHRPEWRLTDPAVYLSPFLDVVQSDDIPAPATGIALSAVLKILRLDVFDERTPNARDGIHSIIFAVTNCRLERTDQGTEDAVLMRILQLLVAVLRARSSPLLTDHAVCTIVNTCFQVVQQSMSRGDLLQRSARYAMHEIIQAVFSRLPAIRADDEEDEEGLSGSDADDDLLAIGYGARCMVDIFRFLCSLLNVGETVDPSEGHTSVNSDEDVQLFALVLINSAIELGGERTGKHPQLLKMIQDDLFHHLIHYATRTSPLVLSMICSTVLNLYNFLRRSLKLQLEAFFTYALLKIASGSNGLQLQEVAIEGILSFCRQPTFVIEMYVNYDCDPVHRNVFEEAGKLLCKTAFPTTNPMAPMQAQAFEGLVTIIRNIADGVETDKAPPRESYDLDISEFKPFWTERCGDAYRRSPDTWVEFVRTRKLKKKKVLMAACHYNRDEKKGLNFLKICQLVPTPPDPKSLAYFFRYTPGLDKSKIGDYLGDPDEFNIKVLAQFTRTFDFCGVILDIALRAFLETFRLPGEAQKIQRVLEAFSEQFFEQQSNEIFVSKDAAYILCYSLIMLNTDQHNPQVKKKMTEEEFIRNNRGINGGQDLPRDYLHGLFLSIATNAITVFGTNTAAIELNNNRWADIIRRSRAVEPFIICDYKHKLSREAFVTISGPTVATLSAIFEQTDDEDILNECVEGMISVARIARYGLEDILDELLCCFCKFTSLLNPYATMEETLFTFSNEMKPRMATLAVFTIANKFGDAIRGAWKNMVDCLLKLKRMRLLPQSVIEPEMVANQQGHSEHGHAQSRSDSGIIFPSSQFGGNNRNTAGLMGRFSQFLSMDSNDNMMTVGNEFENNLKIIKQCRIGSIFTESSKLPDESLQNLGRSLIFAAGGKGQKFSTSVEEEETVGFCWDLIVAITSANLHRFSSFWPQFHDCLAMVSQFPLFSPCPFAEKAIIAFFRISVKLLASSAADKVPEDLVFKTINATWKLDKDILDTCCEEIAESTCQILDHHAGKIQTIIGWKTLLHMLSIAGRHPETFDQGVESLVKLMSEGTHVTRFNYPFCIETAFGFAALKIIPLDTSFKILELMAGSVNWLIQWHKSGYSDPGSNSGSGFPSNIDDGQKVGPSNQGNLAANLFLKLAEALRKTSLVRREEIRNQAVQALGLSFAATDELEFTPANCLACFNLVIFAMVDDLHEKMLEYSRRENSVREMKSMEGTLKEAMDLLVEVYLQFMVPLSQSSGFRTFWLGVLRRMDTCMKANMDDVGTGLLSEAVPGMLKRMLLQMKEKEILVQRDGDELWDITNIQIQWIAPQVKEELFPDEF